MDDRQSYEPGAARGARVDKQGERWTLVLVRDLAHAPARVWEALTEPEHLRQWAPFDAAHSLARPGPVGPRPLGVPVRLHVPRRPGRGGPSRRLAVPRGAVPHRHRGPLAARPAAGPASGGRRCRPTLRTVAPRAAPRLGPRRSGSSPRPDSPAAGTVPRRRPARAAPTPVRQDHRRPVRHRPGAGCPSTGPTPGPGRRAAAARRPLRD